MFIFIVSFDRRSFGHKKDYFIEKKGWKDHSVWYSKGGHTVFVCVCVLSDLTCLPLLGGGKNRGYYI